MIYLIDKTVFAVLQTEFLVSWYESTASYCCHPGIGISIGMFVGICFTPLKFNNKALDLLWARCCQVSYPVHGQEFLAC